MNDAYNQVKIQRPIIGPNIIFMSQLMDYESVLKLQDTTNKHNNVQQSQQSSTSGANSLVTPITVVHTLPANETNNTPTNRSPTTPPSTPIVHGTQIDVQFIKTQKKENSENNSPNALHEASASSYFKLGTSVQQLQQSTTATTTTTGSTASSIKCNSSSSEQKNNSILVFN